MRRLQRPFRYTRDKGEIRAGQTGFKLNQSEAGSGQPEQGNLKSFAYNQHLLPFQGILVFPN